MNTEILKIISDIGWAGAVVVSLLVLKPIVNSIANLLDKKLNGATPANDVMKKLNSISENHLHELKEMLLEIKYELRETNKMLRQMNESLNKIKEKLKIYE
jgi:hypothetical protein